MAIGLGTILGGLGALSGFMQNQSAGRAQARASKNLETANNTAAAQEEAAAKQYLDLLAQRLGIANQAINSGTYDPARLVARLDADVQRNQERNLANMAGAFATMGYRPGDSEPGARLQAAYAQGQAKRDQLAEQLRQTAPLQQIGLLGQAEGGLIGQAASLRGAAANRLSGLATAQYNMNQPQDISGLVASVMPFLNQTHQADTQNSLIGGMYSRGSAGKGRTPSLYPDYGTIRYA